MKLDYSLTPYTKINSKWIKNLNVRPKTIKLLEQNISSKPVGIGLGDGFLYLITKAKIAKAKTKAPKAKINKWDYVKVKNLLHGKGNHQQNEKIIYRMGENFCKSCIC